MQAIWTALHTPAITLPTHRGPNNLPVGIQLVAQRYDDDRLLAAARWIWEKIGSPEMVAARPSRPEQAMEFDNSFDVPLSPAEAWAVLMDIRRIAPCMPGAALTEIIDRAEFSRQDRGSARPGGAGFRRRA